MKLVAKSGDERLEVFELEDDAEVVLGASSKADCTLRVEPCLSRRHLVLRPHGRRVEVERLASASNPVVFKGSPLERFRMRPGDYFVIGTTAFVLEAPAMEAVSHSESFDLSPTEKFTLGADELRVAHDASDRLRLLDLMKLPEVLRTRTRREFFMYACGGLRIATGARWVQVLTVRDDEPQVLCEDVGVDQLTPKPLSQSLIAQALSEAPNPVTYRWDPLSAGDVLATAHEGIGWGICCAAPVPGETPTLFYLAGQGGRAGVGPGGPLLGLRDTARLVGLVADMIGRAMALKKLEDWQAKLGHFFSGKLVSEILEADSAEQLAPRIRPATVMFFDIRGFSLLTEGNLERVLDHQDQLKQVMTAMTQCIFDHDGVVIRYMGDGILACWNVPHDLDDHVEKACLAAMDMVELLGEVTDGWGCGIGLGFGDVVAGSLGSEQVYAYDILGPVVNQTARVEGITKIVGVPILVTQEVAAALSPEKVLARRVARFLPTGMETEVDLYTVEGTPADAAAREAIEQRHALHDRALAAFEKGDWETAFDLLHPIVRDDEAARYIYTLALQRQPPRDWRGVVEMTTK